MLFLKCLDDDSEIEDLIKREIDAREWFVFVDSENSRNSKWVTLEREYITRTDRKKIITVDINDDNSIDDAIRRITHNLRVFISYAHKDDAIARRIINKLEEKDYLVFNMDRIPVGGDYMEVLANAISEASKDGCVIALLTANSIQSKWVRHEILFAIEEGGNVIPVISGDVKLYGRLYWEFSGRPKYYLSENPTDDEIDDMIEQIGRAIIK